jgi:methyl-accepting chemotaxis protein
VPKYQRQLAMALAILQINTGLLYLGIMQFRVRNLAENSRDLPSFLEFNFWLEFLPWTLGISAGVAIAAWMMGLYFSNSIVGPIPRLRRTLEAMGQGDFSQRVKVRPGDAMEFLAEDLNQLAVKLDGKYGRRPVPPSQPDGGPRTAEVVRAGV